jgi:hypothetical protein
LYVLIGLILVHDLTNRKSYLNLRKWLAEVLGAGKELSGNQYSESSDLVLLWEKLCPTKKSQKKLLFKLFQKAQKLAFWLLLNLFK